MNTIRQWLKEGLSKEDYKRAKKYENEHWGIERGSFESALMSAFVWKHTQELEDYWREICEKGGS